MWKDCGQYKDARRAVDTALTQEHFSMTNRIYKGVIVMNIHKSKGKEFDEVIIWEDLHKPIIYSSGGNISQQDKLTLRVAVTRAKSRTTLMTPKSQPCILL